MSNRRNFLKTLPAALAVGSLSTSCSTDADTTGHTAIEQMGTSEAIGSQEPNAVIKPVVISTWNHGQAANAKAWDILEKGGTALDAVEAGVMVTEADPNVRTVGIGGFPDRDGVVTLDACIMNEKGDCGSVAGLEEILHPISVARMVMERTPHIMLVGQGAQDFALAQGMEKTNLLTDKSRVDWEKWKQENPDYLPKINVENHDTIGLLALDKNGNISGACTTSGAAYKYHGRVGDSPLIGAGLYVDNEVGGATATGWGEAVIRACGTFLVVEFMRQGHHPREACKMAVERVISKYPDWQKIQVGFIALDKHGRTGGYCIQSGFNYALKTPAVDNELFDPGFKIEVGSLR